MRQILSKFKVFEEPGDAHFWGNLASENVLLANYPSVQTTTDLSSNPIELLETVSPGKSITPLSDFLMKSGRVVKVATETVTWKLRTAGKIYPIAVSKIYEGEYPGLQATKFPIHLNSDIYVEGDILSPVIAPDLEVRVMRDENGAGDNYGLGDGFVYTVQLVAANLDTYFPPEMLEPGIQWFSADRTAYGEASGGYGSWSLNGTGYISFQTSMSDVARRARVTNKAHELHMLRIQPCDQNGNRMEKMHDKIINKIEAEFILANKREKENTLFWGRSAGKNIIDETSGHYVRRGAGMVEFMEDGNELEYPLYGGSIEIFEDFLQSMWAAAGTNPDSRNVVLYTGIGGYTLWNRWLSARYATSGIPQDFNTFVGKTSSWDSKNAQGLVLGTAQFVETKLFPYGSIRVEHWPTLDDREMNGGLLHPDTGLPLSSYQFYLLDFGTGSGNESNIDLLERDTSQEVYTHLCGVWSPAGPINTMTAKNAGFHASHEHAYYDLLYRNTFGIRINNINKLARFIPAIR